MQERIYDFIGIGIGPFNLGLAALAAPLSGLDGVFLDQAERFDWHPGMLLDHATMQTSFIADLVTLADPTSPYSFLNYCKQAGRLYSFYIRENFFLLRQEYNQYCQWVAQQLPALRFGQCVHMVRHVRERGCYELHVQNTADGSYQRYLTRRLVLGTGTRPDLPACCQGKPVIHSAHYQAHKAALQHKRCITVVGSGQSAAEIYLDLLRDARRCGYQVDWITRSPRFFPLEYTKLTLEMTSPDYVAYFHALPQTVRDPLLESQKGLYKGINRSLIDAIYDELYRQSLSGPPPSRLLCNTEVSQVHYHPSANAQGARFELELQHSETGQRQMHSTQAVIMASGYHYQEPAFLTGISSRIMRDSDGRFAVARNYSIDREGSQIFVQNAELHTHGLAAPDLTMACWRNSIILREMLGHAPYPIEEQTAFQTFGLPATQRVENVWA